MSEAIVIVDPQYDFFPGGTLGVTGGDEIIKPINMLLNTKLECLVFVSQDWHPKETVHFAAQGGDWPSHCVQDSRGAEIHESLAIELDSYFVKKGTDPEDDAGYSAFEGRDKDGTLLVDLLRSYGITSIIVCGLATDYCVRATVLDAIKEGFTVQLYADGVRPVNLSPEDGIAAVADMLEAGATLLLQEELDGNKDTTSD